MIRENVHANSIGIRAHFSLNKSTEKYGHVEIKRGIGHGSAVSINEGL